MKKITEYAGLPYEVLFNVGILVHCNIIIYIVITIIFREFKIVHNFGLLNQMIHWMSSRT